MTKKQQRLLYTALLIGGALYAWFYHGEKIKAWFAQMMGGGASGGGGEADGGGTCKKAG